MRGAISRDSRSGSADGCSAANLPPACAPLSIARAARASSASSSIPTGGAGCRRRASGNRHDRAAGRPRGRRPRRLALSWIGEDTLEARFPLQKAGLYLGAVQLGTGTVLPLAPLSLPYSPEFEPRTDPEEGKKTLQEIARVTGGAERTTWDDVFSARLLRNRQVKDLVIPLALMLLLLHMTEIAGRRLLWFQAARRWLNSLKMPLFRRRPLQPAPFDDAQGRPEHRGGGARTRAGKRHNRTSTRVWRDRAGARPVRRSPKGEGGGPLERAKNKARSRMSRG